MHGQVVHARQGQRTTYRPVVSTLTPSAEPAAVLGALLDLHPFRTVYVADLDALLNRGSHDAHLQALAPRFPEVTFWVDRGTTAGAEFPNHVEVLGSESLAGNWREILAGRSAPFILSLDFGSEGFLGPQELPDSPVAWPETVILMTLQRVGSHGGPDIALLERHIALDPAKRFVTAGGVRNGDDLRRLQEAGTSGVLVASALHDGNIRSADLAAFG